VDDENDPIAEALERLQATGLTFGFQRMWLDYDGEHWALLTHTFDLTPEIRDQVAGAFGTVRYEFKRVAPTDGWLYRHADGKAWKGKDGKLIRNPSHDRKDEWISRWRRRRLARTRADRQSPT
jgi:hypothetical protein